MVPSLRQSAELATDSKSKSRVFSLPFYLVCTVVLQLALVSSLLLFQYFNAPFFYSLLAASACLILFLFLCIILRNKLFFPLKRMRRGVSRYAKGDFGHHIPESGLTEIDRLARSLNRMQERIQHLEAVRSDFVANVSHELKTPITSIKGFVETLQAGAKENPEDLERFLDIVAQQAERLNLIISDLLTLSRLEGAKERELLRRQEEDVLSMIREVEKSVFEAREAKHISFKIRCDEDLVASFDRFLIEQALANLIGNAVKYSGANTEISITAWQDEEQLKISVEDHGPGISKQHQPRLFERFYRVDWARDRKAGGTGLGLAIVKHIAAVHGGSVTVSSQLGEGSNFTLQIPLEDQRL